MTPEAARELRHEIRTPVNHLIGYAELLLEEGVLAPSASAALGEIRSQARTVLTLLPQFLADDGTVTDGARVLADRARELQASARDLRSSPGTLAPADLDRLVQAADRLEELAARLTTGAIGMHRDSGEVQDPRSGVAETILVVDDDEANRDVLGRRLQRLGFGVVEARNGIEALKMMAMEGIDLVLLDAMMPQLDGFGVLERRRADPALLEVPVIMISALDQMESIVRGIELGAEDYLPKPFDPVLLRARINSSLEKKRRRAAELSYLADVRILTEAAADFEQGRTTRGAIDLVAQRPDELGQLAQVLAKAADQIREREALLRSELRTRGYAFMSYASIDRGRVEPIVQALTDAGLNVWMDRRDLHAGANWAAEIVQSIRGCSALLIACSPAAFESRNVRQEVQVAGKYNRPYIPIILEQSPLPDEIEYQLEGWQWVDVRDLPTQDWLPGLIEALARHDVVPFTSGHS